MFPLLVHYSCLFPEKLQDTFTTGPVADDVAVDIGSVRRVYEEIEKVKLGEEEEEKE